MKTIVHPTSDGALTLIEVLAVVVILFVLAGLVVPSGCCVTSKRKAQRIDCVNKLKQTGLAFGIYANDHEEKFPWQVSTNQRGSTEFIGTAEIFRHFLAASNELGTPKVLVCNTDQRSPAPNFQSLTNGNLSYFFNLDADPTSAQAILAGDRNITTDPPQHGPTLLLAPRMTVGWGDDMHKRAGNIALADGSVLQTSRTALQIQLSLSQGTNRILVP